MQFSVVSVRHSAHVHTHPHTHTHTHTHTYAHIYIYICTNTQRDYLKTKKDSQLIFPQRSMNTSYIEETRAVETEGAVVSYVKGLKMVINDRN